MNKDFNGGYIVASKKAFKLLIKEGYKPTENYVKEFPSIFISSVVKNGFFSDGCERMEGGLHKQFYINNGELSWIKPKTDEEQKAEDEIVALALKETISIEDDNGVAYEFEKHKTRLPKLLKVVETTRYNDIHIIGYVYLPEQNEIIAGHWDILGNFVSGRANYKDYNLTPIKPEWYDNKSIFPARVVGTSGMAANTHYTVDRMNNLGVLCIEGTGRTISPDNCRLATKKELLSLHYEGKQNEH